MGLDDLNDGRFFNLAAKIVSDRYHAASGKVINRPSLKQEIDDVYAEIDNLKSVIKTNSDYLDKARNLRLIQSSSSVRTLIASSDGNGDNGSLYHFSVMSSYSGPERFGRHLRISAGLVKAEEGDEDNYLVNTDPKVKKMKPEERLKCELLKRVPLKEYFE